MKELIVKHVVRNAAKYGKANEKAVIGKIIAENPELRSKAKELLEEIRKTIEWFESLSEEEKEELFRKYVEEKEERVEERKLPPLENVKGKVVMRFAPNPNGPPTLGSARGIVINHEYAKMYKGKFILRFDDTDPRTKRPMIEAYDWYLEDCEWLGAKPDEVVYASKRIPIYYEYAEKLIEMGKAYVCFCEREEFKKYKDAGEECPHRNTPAEDNLEFWRKMLEGEYKEGEAVLRIKTDMKHKDPAVRDWVAFRIIYESHPLVGDAYFVYPTLDFESAIEDHLLGVTHILRGKDLADSEKRQRYIYEYFGWEYPVVKLWGRVSIHEFGKLSTSSIKKAIEEGKFTGWDDPRLPTLKALRRRGFEPEAIRNFFISLGVGENDVSVSMKNLYAENRKIVDKKANRYFFVWDPVEIEIEGLEEREVEVPLHPNKKDKRVLKGERRVYLTRDDFERFKGKEVRLKDFCNILLRENFKAEFVSFELKEAKKGRNIIHWLPKSQALKCRVLGVERDYEGLVEDNVVKEVDKVVQFERFAFCRIEKASEESVLAIYTHP
ncbi:glutamyl-tRNA synthetase [Ferroglobus placidus DSM 10642]|uniref:Glutamate--tRNA ligase n=1 Tax=Ferroglobus placidus (strain DSM 10642 / AEDII12DO) TaxID=589924 RepID=D3RYT9_FERPA|nr:glutamate--tRNA ligase [Ferroglobus placidus]ADC65652.1 glutamyl-tRNA synthetase [Ferroglobus placidus DSM 10642]